MPVDVPIPIIVLAAGGSTRFGITDKLLTPVAGRSLLSWTLQSVVEQRGETDPGLVVVGPGSGRPARLSTSFGLHAVHAPDAQRGIRCSIAAGIRAVEQGVGGPGAVILLGDDPLAARRLGEVLAAARTAPDDVIAIRRTSKVPHPVYLPRTTWADVTRIEAATAADEGLRALLASDGTRWLPHPDDRTLDVDVPDDAARLAALLG